MGTQEDTFLSSEGDAWFARNWLKMGQGADPIQEAIQDYDLLPPPLAAHVIELGCGNGWRLAQISERFNANCGGVDPSIAAVANANARFKHIDVRRGTATAHPWPTGCARILIYGFCLYVCDPEDHFEIAAQGNNILADEGYIIIHDFDPEFPHSVPNHHVQGLNTYKMDWSKLWLGHPSYSLVVKKSLPDGTAVWVLRKSIKEAFPCS